MVLEKEKVRENCLVMLSTDISTSFEMKKHTVAVFLDIRGAYDNVLIDAARKRAASRNCPMYVEPAVV
jgi:hypothetical protein